MNAALGSKAKKCTLTFLLIALVTSLLVPINAFAVDEATPPPTTNPESQLSEDTGFVNTEDGETGTNTESLPLDGEGSEDDSSTEDVVNAELGTLALDPAGLAAAGWTQYTGAITHQITSFSIANRADLTGYLGVGSPSYTPSNYLNEASYYIQQNDGASTRDITYAYELNSFDTSYFDIFVDNGSGFDDHDIGYATINSIWTKEMTLGYTSLLLEGVYTSGAVSFQVNVSMTPNASGIVQYEWSITNLGNDADIVAVFSIDTELEGDDYVPIYSLGTNNGMYMDNSTASHRLLLPAVPASAGGPVDYAAAEYFTSCYTVFGNNLDTVRNRDVPRAVDEVLLSSVDTAVYFRYAPATLLTGEVQNFVYQVGIQADQPSTLPATGDSSAATLFAIIIGLGAIAGLVFVIRRSTKQPI